MLTVETRLLTVEEAAKRLRQSRDTLYRRIHTGELEAVRIGERGPLRIPESALAELLQPASSATRPDPALRRETHGRVALDAETEEER